MIYIDDANISTILSRLLVQDEPDLEDYIRSVLLDVCQNDEVPSLKELVSSNPVPIFLELLMMSGEADETTKPAVSVPPCLLGPVTDNGSGTICYKSRRYLDVSTSKGGQEESPPRRWQIHFEERPRDVAAAG